MNRSRLASLAVPSTFGWRIPTLIFLAALSWPAFGAQTLLPTNSVWKYLDTGTDLGATWRATNFNDSAWAGGPAPLGYGDPVATTVGFGGDAAAKYITTYFRTTFVVNNPALSGSLELRLRRDDGAIVYLNGVEINRSNLGQGAIGFNTLASSTIDGAGETAFASSAAPNLLRPGTNYLAVEIHQATAGSSDIVLDLEVIGNSAPNVAITSPSNGTVLSGPTNVALAATAIDTDGTVSKVEFFESGQKLGDDTSFPYSFLLLQVEDGVYSYAARATDHTGGSADSTPVTVTVNDPGPPRLVSASGTTNQVKVKFSKRLNGITATNIAHYQLSNVVSITSASLSADLKTVTLITGYLPPGGVYAVIVNGVQDLAGAPVAANSRTNFLVEVFAFQTVGSVTAPGSVTGVAGGYDIRAAGRDIGETADDFGYYSRLRTGDFDVAVRVAGLDLSDGYSEAGLMARVGLATNSPFAAVLAGSPLAGVKFQSRATTNSVAVDGNSMPVNHPHTWLRLRRVGNVFTGFGGFDGQTWRQLGSVTLATAPSQVSVGFAVSSHHPAVAALAQFRDITEAPGGTFVSHLDLPFEPLGPSARRTALAISEIMYHPPEVPGQSLEFIEIFNSQDYYEDLSGFDVDGDVHYTFPQGTILPSGAFIVVARDPVAVQNYYGINGVLGPWRLQTNVIGTITNINAENLPNSRGTVRLESELGAHLLEVEYDSTGAWPAAADGAGHSLVLARPSYGEGDPSGWAQSESIGGSPGRHEVYQPSPQRAIVINEFLAHTDLPHLDFVELFNTSTQAVEISGCWLSDDFGTNKFRIPDGTVLAGRSAMAWNETQLGFSLSSDGEEILLVNSNLTRVLDTVRFEGQENGVSRGRFPDGSPGFVELSADTPGATNAAPLLRDIVINEIMYSPISDNDDDEFIELYNRGAAAVNVGGWRLVEGINFTVPANTMMAAGGYLVVAKNRTNLLARHPGLNAAAVVGDYSGQLANSGERVALGMPDYSFQTNGPVITTNVFHIVVNEVTYRDGGRWGQWSDGGGSSLELIDARADNRLALNWGDSDETAKAPWTLIERTGLIDLGFGGGNGAPNRFEFWIEDAGECLVDDVEVRNNGGANVVTNPGFESGTSGWAFQGTHAKTFGQTGGALSGNQALHVRAGGRGDTGPNKVRTGIPQLTTGGANTATLRARVRWLRGDPNFLMRIRGQWIEATGRMTLPTNLGTPGAPNSRSLPNAGPAIDDVAHYPPLPAANEPVVVTARVTDPDSFSATLRYRIDPGTSFLNVPMNDHGTAGDATAGDGIYSGTIPGQGPNVMAAFHVSATDSHASPATALFPNNPPTRECLVRFGETVRAGAIATYRLWVTATNVNYWTSRERNSNEGLDCTFVYAEGRRVVYNAETLYSGSPFHTQFGGYSGPLGTTCDYEVNFPGDDQFLGNEDFVLNGQNPVYSGTFHQDVSAQAETTAYWFGRKLGLGFNHKRHVFVVFNGQPRGMIYFDHQQPNTDIIDEYYPNDPNGRLLKIEDWFEFDDTGDQLANLAATLQDFTLAGQKRTERYRFTWRPRARTEPNDFADLFAAVDAANAPGPEPYTSAVFGELDVRNWMRLLALEHMIGNWDSYGYERGKNMYAYKPERDRWKLVLWDLDLVLGKDSREPTDGLFDNGSEPVVTRMYNHPPFVREFWNAMHELATIWMDPNVYSPLVEARYAAFRANGVPVDTPDQGQSSGSSGGMRGWIAARRAYILTQLPVANFAVTSTNYVQTPTNYATISGTAPVTAAEILVNGGAYPITWTTVTNWSVRVPLAAGTNALVVRPVNSAGEAVGSDVTVTANFTGATPNPADHIVVTEIMFNPPADETSFVELFNTHSSYTFDLSGWRINGLGYTFPAGSTFPPRAHLVLAKNRYELAKIYGALTPFFDQFPGSLDNDGETLTLLRPSGTPAGELVVDKVKYEGRAPWSAHARGLGGSLQLIDLTQDNARVSNWTDGRDWRFFSLTGIPNSARLLMYLDTPGNLLLDDLMLVAGSVPSVGTNLFANGGFESPLSPAWPSFGANGTNTSRTTESRVNGDYAMNLSFSAAGGGSHYLYQDIPSYATTAVHTLSFWYLPSSNAANFVFRMSAGFRGTINVRAPSGPLGLSATPGANSVVTNSIAPYPLVWLNEVLPVNPTGITDNLGEREPWIELFNSSSNPIALGEFFLTDDFTRLGKWRFPSNAVINPGQFEVIYADGEPGESTADQWHTSFRLSGTNDSLALSRMVNGGPQVVDYLNFPGLTPTRSYGSYPDGQLFDRRAFALPSPGISNNPAGPPIAVYINEWMAANTGFIRDPADNRADDWFELYNAQSAPVDLGGYFLTDTLSNQFQFAIPNNGHYLIPGFGYLLVWADGEPNQNSTNHADLHVNFSLRQAGEAIGLFAPDGTLVDAIAFGAQNNNVSQGHYPGGTGPVSAMATPTPRAANGDPNVAPEIISIVAVGGTQVSFTIRTIPGRTYQVENKNHLGETSWTPLDGPRLASGSTLTVPDNLDTNAHRFYRVVLLP